MLLLLLSHFVGDYTFQTEYMALNKGKDNYVLAAHVATWTYVIYMMANFLGLHVSEELLVFVLFIPHYVMDYIKARNKLWCKKVSSKLALTIDQSFHFLQIIVFYMIAR